MRFSGDFSGIFNLPGKNSGRVPSQSGSHSGGPDLCSAFPGAAGENPWSKTVEFCWERSALWETNRTCY